MALSTSTGRARDSPCVFGAWVDWVQQEHRSIGQTRSVDNDSDRSADHAALGEMVALVRSLEFVVYRVAKCLGVHDPARRSATRAIEDAKKQVRLGLPPWAPDLPPASMKAWLRQAKGVLTDRNRHVHWFHGVLVDDDVDIQLSPRTGALQLVDDVELSWLTERARAAVDAGHSLLCDHLHVALPDGQQVPPGEHQGMERLWLSWGASGQPPRLTLEMPVAHG